MLRDRWLVAFLFGVCLGALTLYIVQQIFEVGVTDEDLIAEYYRIENLVSVSPHDIKVALEKGTSDQYVVVDLRSQAEYETEHVTSAVNVPIFVDPAESGMSNDERILKAFAKIQAENPDRDIIAYCYSAACMASRKVGLMLAENGIYIKHLNIGWYEWKYYWTLWNGEDDTTAVEFITQGSEPGVKKATEIISPCGEGEFSC